MRICLVNSNVPWGGGERWVHQHALLARHHGHEVDVVVHPESELARRLAPEPGIGLHPRPIGQLSLLNPAALLGLKNLFARLGPDAVLMCLPRDLKLAGVAARLAGVPRIVFRRGIDVPVRNTRLNRLLYGRVMTRLVCNTEATKRSVLAANPDLIAPDRISVVPNGIDLAEFDARPVVPMNLAREGETVIGCAARLTAQKGVGLLLEAAARLLDEGLPVRLAIAGEGELRQGLERTAESLGIGEQVDFLGFVEDIKSFYASIDILALPSLFEGFGYVIVEAGRMGKPCVAFATSSNPEVVKHEATGLLAAPGDPADLAAMLGRLARDPELARAMGEHARIRVERFDTGRTWELLLAALGE